MAMNLNIDTEVLKAALISMQQTVESYKKYGTDAEELGENMGLNYPKFNTDCRVNNDIRKEALGVLGKTDQEVLDSAGNVLKELGLLEDLDFLQEAKKTGNSVEKKVVTTFKQPPYPL